MAKGVADALERQFHGKTPFSATRNEIFTKKSRSRRPRTRFSPKNHVPEASESHSRQGAPVPEPVTRNFSDRGGFQSLLAGDIRVRDGFVLLMLGGNDVREEFIAEDGCVAWSNHSCDLERCKSV